MSNPPLFDPDGLDRPPAAPEQLTGILPARILAYLPPRSRRTVDEMARRPARSARDRRCAWPDCPDSGAEYHHALPRAKYGQLAEYGPILWYCHRHHDLVSDVEIAHDRAIKRPRHNGDCVCEGRGWIETEDAVLGDWLFAPCPGELTPR
jgi:hypothetical protein